MKKRTLTIISRKSPLALWQATWVKNQIEKIYPDVRCKIIGCTTEGDRTTTAFVNQNVKELFVKDLQKSLLNHKIDIAVHSIKDMSTKEHPDLILGAFLEREDPRDAFISQAFSSLNELPPNGIIGTSSPRRESQLKQLRPDCHIKAIRGNVGTRLDKLNSGEYDAIILAAAGLKRLKLQNNIKAYFNPHEFVPAIGQGSIGIECHRDNDEIQQLIKALDHRETRLCVTAERAVNHYLGGDCLTPMGAYAFIKDNQLYLSAFVAKTDGSLIIRTEVQSPPEEAEKLGSQAALDLINQGADSIL